jgi:hypothetical protein
MAGNNTLSSLELEEPRTRGKPTCFQTLRHVCKPWVIAAVLFYCASVITVGLLAGLLPQRTQHITLLATPTGSFINSTVTTPTTESPTNSTITTTASYITSTAPDPSQCIDDECNPRLSSGLIVRSYELEYLYNNTRQTAVQGQVTIEFTLQQSVKQLIYHSKRMIRLDEPALFEDGVYRFVSMRKYIPNDYISLRLTSNSSFVANRYRLVQKFLVSLTDGNVGFYQSIFKDGNETTG